jgi:2'-hydroxyisoflavone reductase
MDLLILGGTVFLGRHLVEAARSGGHVVTLFNRGQHNPELFPAVEKLRGDRDGALDALSGRKWDAVIDTCGYVPRIVGQSAEALAEAVASYVFISTISVYASLSRPGIKEDSPLAALEEATEQVTGDSYGPLKAACEQVVQSAFPGRSLIIRPGLIVGPHDPTDRFTYWPVRLKRGGDVVAPEPRHAPVQIIDVRDLAEWIVRMVEMDASGVFNAAGPSSPLTMGELLEQCREAIDSHARLCWLPADELLTAGIEPWWELPLWVPGDDVTGMLATDNGRALASGLTFRPLADTARDTLAWALGRPSDHPWRAGLTSERERAVLDGQRSA